MPVRALSKRDLPETDLPDAQNEVDALRRENERLRQDIRILEIRTAELERLADSDTLTPLLNRRAFLREVERAIARTARHGISSAVFLADLDGLKAINDSGGHQAGDAVLLHVGYTLRAEVRTTDIVARIGGDEFGLVLEALDETAAAAKAMLLCTAVSAETVEAVTPAISIGHTLVRADDTLDAIIARADAMMYAAKRAQRSRR
jgi:diguanylate cyclase (GGDEF)-like protein